MEAVSKARRISFAVLCMLGEIFTRNPVNTKQDRQHSRSRCKGWRFLSTHVALWEA